MLIDKLSSRMLKKQVDVFKNTETGHHSGQHKKKLGELGENL